MPEPRDYLAPAFHDLETSVTSQTRLGGLDAARATARRRRRTRWATGAAAAAVLVIVAPAAYLTLRPSPEPAPQPAAPTELSVLTDLNPPTGLEDATIEVPVFDGAPQCPSGSVAFTGGLAGAPSPDDPGARLRLGWHASGDVDGDASTDTVVEIGCEIVEGGTRIVGFDQLVAYSGAGTLIGRVAPIDARAEITERVAVVDGGVETVLYPIIREPGAAWRDRYVWTGSGFVSAGRVELAVEAVAMVDLTAAPVLVPVGEEPSTVRVRVGFDGAPPSQPVLVVLSSLVPLDIEVGGMPLQRGRYTNGEQEENSGYDWLFLTEPVADGELTLTVALDGVWDPSAAEPGLPGDVLRMTVAAPPNAVEDPVDPDIPSRHVDVVLVAAA